MQYMLVHAVDDELAAAKPWDEAAQASLEAWLDQTIGQKVNLHGSRLRPQASSTRRRCEGSPSEGSSAQAEDQLDGVSGQRGRPARRCG